MRYLIIILVVLGFVHNSFATTTIPLEFSKMVVQSEVVIEGTVIDLEVISSGSEIRQSKLKSHESPKKELIDEEKAKETIGSDFLSTPQGLPVEGGKMLFTEVTLAVERSIVGNVYSTVRFRVAGGNDDKTSVIVFGMPKFELGKRYVIFLKPNFEETADPIIGVNQGYFEISQISGTGEEILLNANGDIVIGIENDQVLVQRNLDCAISPIPKLELPPVPEAGSNVQSEVSPEVERYWSSIESPLSLNDFIVAIQAAKE